jgi:hypothetical protein
VELFGEKNDDEELLAWAAANARVLATCDKASKGSLAAGWTKGGLSRWSSGRSNATAR